MRLSFFVCCIICSLPCLAQVTDSSIAADAGKDSLKTHHLFNIYQSVTDSNYLLNIKGEPHTSSEQPRKQNREEETFFYIIAGLLLTMGIMKTFYSRYFTTLFRVFSNTSLRQNQLTDQLEQAKLPSLIFNIFFTLTGGLFVFLILRYRELQVPIPQWKLIGLCTAAIAVCYLVKYFIIRFIGWVTNYRSEAGVYIFIIFLLNKIIGILLLPFIVLLSFSKKSIASYALFVAVMMISFILLMRFYRSYSLLRSKLQINGLHFLLYILALEILPIALLYKSVVLFFSINS